MKAPRKRSFLHRLTAVLMVLTFPFTTIIPSYGQEILNLPVPGSMVPLSPGFVPTILKGVKIYPSDPLRFDFIVDTGHSGLKGDALKEESQRLIKYFLASLTVPEDSLWVNLSPYEKDKIIPADFGQTEMGRDLLAQDYILKQITASLIYPEDELGKKFWEKVYQKAQTLYGTTDIPLNTFNKVWIIPEKAVVYVEGETIFVAESHLKVLLEEDYLALEHNSYNQNIGADKISKDKLEQVSGVSSSIVREIVIPELEKEVNEGKNFAQLRQIYNSVILATWFKKNLKESFLGKVYANQNKTKGIESNNQKINEEIYQRYVEAYKKGVYNFVKEDYDFATQQMIPRKYFSGGAKLDATDVLDSVVSRETPGQPSLLARAMRKLQGPAFVIATYLGACTASGCSSIQPGKLPDRPVAIEQIQKNEKTLQRAMDTVYFADRLMDFIRAQDVKQKTVVLEAAAPLGEELVNLVTQYMDLSTKKDPESHTLLAQINEKYLLKAGLFAGDIQDSDWKRPKGLVRADKQLVFSDKDPERLIIELDPKGFVLPGTGPEFFIQHDIYVSYPEMPSLAQLSNLKGWKSRLNIHVGSITYSAPYEIIDYVYKESEGVLYFAFEIIQDIKLEERPELTFEPTNDPELQRMQAETKALQKFLDVFRKSEKEQVGKNNRITGRAVMTGMVTGLARLKYLGLKGQKFPAVTLKSGMSWGHDELRSIKQEQAQEKIAKEVIIKIEDLLGKELDMDDLLIFSIMPSHFLQLGRSTGYEGRLADELIGRTFKQAEENLTKETQEIKGMSISDVIKKYPVLTDKIVEEINQRKQKRLAEIKDEDLRDKTEETFNEMPQGYVIARITMAEALRILREQERNRIRIPPTLRLIQNRDAEIQKRIEAIDSVIAQLNASLEKDVWVGANLFSLTGDYSSKEMVEAYNDTEILSSLRMNGKDVLPETIKKKYNIDVIPAHDYEWQNKMEKQVVQWLIEELKKEKTQLEQERASVPAQSQIKTGQAQEKVETPGGIDFNPKNFDVKTQGDKIEFKIPAEYQNLENTPINGFIPNIFRISPLTNFVPLLSKSEIEGEQAAKFVQQ
ncbi:MAG: hypothetical protein A2Z88_06625 [Omnitrophica WOR_2 bacterium GWA2_47_8]|nr:MAG: hypothetical protein A2Z88_06625 [Omnitrophica WOR_2 bacterium GWA2_47_8]